MTVSTTVFISILPSLFASGFSSSCCHDNDYYPVKRVREKREERELQLNLSAFHLPCKTSLFPQEYFDFYSKSLLPPLIVFFSL